MSVRAHVDPATKEIKGYYPIWVEYPSLPPEDELVMLSSAEWDAAVQSSATHWTEAGAENRNPPLPEGFDPSSPPELTFLPSSAEEKVKELEARLARLEAGVSPSPGSP